MTAHNEESEKNKRKTRTKKKHSWENDIRIIPNQFGSSATNRSIELYIDILEERLEQIFNKEFPEDNYRAIRKEAEQEIKAGTVDDETFSPLWVDMDPLSDSPPDQYRAVVATYYTALADIENASGNPEKSLKAIAESRYLVGYFDGYQHAKLSTGEKINSNAGTPGGKKRKEMLSKITNEAARLLATLAPPEGWKNKLEATKIITPTLDDYIIKENLGKVVKETSEFLRKGYSQKLEIKEAFNKNSAKNRQRNT